MNDQRKTRLSKRLSYVLRHAPQSVGVTLDAAGWTAIDGLLSALAASGAEMTREELSVVVATSAKQRFALSDDGLRIRASQGHSVEVELGYEAADPPSTLFHGTHGNAVASIVATGLEPRGRHHVHLSADTKTAREVGARRGRPVIFAVDAAAMTADGALFFVSANGVWLTAAVPSAYLRVLAPDQSWGSRRWLPTRKGQR